MDISLTSLKYFKKTAELQHMTRAAQSLHIPQSSLSYVILSLEKELGVPLFSRKGRNIVLTPYGKELAETATRMLHDMDRLKARFAAMKKEESRTVKLSFMALANLAPLFLMKVKKAYPNIQLEVDFPHASEMVSQSDMWIDIDLALVSSAEPIKGMNAVPLFKEELMMALPDSDPRSRASVVKLRDFEHEKFIRLQSEPTLGDVVETYCQKAGFEPQYSMESDNSALIREFIRTGLGILIVPNVTWGNIGAEGISLIPITDPQCHRYISLVWPKDKVLSEGEELLKEYIVRNITHLIKQAAWK